MAGLQIHDNGTFTFAAGGKEQIPSAFLGILVHRGCAWEPVLATSEGEDEQR